MSLESVLARIDEIRAFTVPAAPQAQPSPQASTTSFASYLAAATVPAAGATASAPDVPEQYRALIGSSAAKHGVDPLLIAAVINRESGFNPSATSSAGAAGLMQLMPGTASGLGVTNVYDPAQSIEAGTRYLKIQLDRFGGDVRLALAAYNAGPNAVARYGGVPPYEETQRYVERVLSDYAAMRAGIPGGVQ